jgi:hypothetical protein
MTWDATDELYITYNEDGERVITTTGGDQAIWVREHSYQETGSHQYEALADLSGRTDAGAIGGWPSGASGGAGRELGPTAEYPEVHVGGDGDNARPEPSRGAEGDHPRGGESAIGAPSYAQHWPDAGRLPERPDSRAIRSHRHCPGCTGHRFVNRSFWAIGFKAIGAWVVGWFATVVGGTGISLIQYFSLSTLIFLVAFLIRPLWREFVEFEDAFSNGGQR